jgi:hypothetical protein
MRPRSLEKFASLDCRTGNTLEVRVVWSRISAANAKFYWDNEGMTACYSRCNNPHSRHEKSIPDRST